MRIIRRVDFSSSHVVRNPSLSDEENQRLYGSASNPNGHGHNYVLEVVLEGEPDDVTGMIIDLKEVKEILKRRVVDPFDHRHLNKEVSPFDRVVPTAENIAVEIWNRLAPEFHGTRAKLVLVRLHETEDLFIEYAGNTN